MIKVPISNGELIDKITVLQIKSEKIKDEAKLKNIKKELKMLEKLFETNLKDKDVDPLFTRLKEINLKLWEIEDRLREKERKKEFDSEFIELARGVYYTNDERSRIKKEIDRLTGSQITEEKSYEKYD
jgi:hypothetical protein